MATNLRARVLLVAILVLSPWRVSPAQGAASIPDPTATVQSFWRAVFAMRYAEAVRYLDLGDLDRARRMEIESARVRRGREYTIEDLMRRDPDMPREAAEYEVRKREKMRQQYPERPFFRFFGVDSASQLERMPLDEVAVRWLQAHDPLWLMQEHRRTHQCPPSPEADSAVSTRHAVVYGAAMAGPDTAYVVFKATWIPLPELPPEAGEFQLPRLAILRKGASGWRIRALEELVQVFGGLYGMSNCPPKKP